MILKTQIRNIYNKRIGLKGEPEAIDYGLVIGTFVGVTSAILFSSEIILIIGLLFRHNITAGYLQSWIISNPVTIPLLYQYQYELGHILPGTSQYNFTLMDYTLTDIAALKWQILCPLAIGGVIMTPLIAVPAYYISRRLIAVGQAKRKV